MIICKTPLRISLFGGGTDLPIFFKKSGGAVIGTAIDKYIYHTASNFPSKLFDYSVRISYSEVERVQSTKNIQHRPFREILKHMRVERDIEIHIASDLPSFSGLGTSSAFTVGLLNCLHAYKGQSIEPSNLTQEAIKIEHEILKEAVGYQDQTFAAYGGFKIIRFSRDGNIELDSVNMSSDKYQEMSENLLLFFTGITRKANAIEANKIKNIKKINENLNLILKHVDHAYNIMTGNLSIDNLGLLLDQTWQEKRKLDYGVTSKLIDEMYELGINSGALGGKLLGAGGGGFMLFYVPRDRQERMRKSMSQFHEIKFTMNAQGSTIIHR